LGFDWGGLGTELEFDTFNRTNPDKYLCSDPGHVHPAPWDYWGAYSNGQLVYGGLNPIAWTPAWIEKASGATEIACARADYGTTKSYILRWTAGTWYPSDYVEVTASGAGGLEVSRAVQLSSGDRVFLFTNGRLLRAPAGAGSLVWDYQDTVPELDTANGYAVKSLSIDSKGRTYYSVYNASTQHGKIMTFRASLDT
jgi:hypothetical protein